MSTDTDARHQAYRDVGLWTDERLGWMFPQAAARFPERDYLVYEGRHLSYRHVLQWVEQVAVQLVGDGLTPGDRLLIQLPNCVEALVYQLAAFRIGVVPAPIISIYRGRELTHMIRDLRPAGVLTVETLGDRSPVAEIDRICAEAGVQPKGRYCATGAVGAWSATLPEPAAGDGATGATVGLPDPLPADECALILYTSGTTALPKGVMLSGRALVSQSKLWRQRLDLNSGDTVVCVAPLSHLAGVLNGFLVPVAANARCVLMPKWDPDAAVEIMRMYQGSVCISAALFLSDVVERYERGESPDHRLHTWSAGAGSVPPLLVERAEAVGVHAFRTYGMTEAAGAITLPNPNDPLAQRAHTDGRLLEGTELEAVDEHRRPLPPGEVGELRARGPQMLMGYTDPDLSAAQIDADGWFYTGDLGSVRDGWVDVRGRVKDIINRGGEKFSALDIELALTAHPVIKSAAVVGAPDLRFGEVVAAFVVLEEGATWPGPEPVLEHLRELDLAKQKWPVRWNVVDQLPISATGKVQKQALRDQLLAEYQNAGANPS